MLSGIIAAASAGESSLSRLLRFELVQLPLLPGNFGVLRLNLPLHIRVLFLPSLHLITDQRPAEKSDGSPTTRAGAGIPRSTADDRAQAGSSKGSDRSALFSRRQRLRAAEKKQTQ
jgi:hypothetical protein